MATHAAKHHESESGNLQARYAWENAYPEGQDWRAPVETGSVVTILEQAVTRFADRPAIDAGEMSVTYAELGALTDKVAAGLQAIGVKKGVKVGLFLPNTLYSVAFYYGALKAGATVVNYNPLYADQELVHQITDSETTVFVTLSTKALMEKAESVLQKTCLEKIVACPDVFGEDVDVNWDQAHVSYADIVDNNGTYESVAVDPEEDIAVLQYTGGTTGVPKGAMLTHANLYANTMQMGMWYKDITIPGQEKQMAVIPLFHVFAMTVVMNMSVFYGMEIVVVTKFDPKSLITTLGEKKPSFFPAVPAVFNALLNHSTVDELDLSCVKFCCSGGAPLPLEVKKSMEEKVGANIGEGYGLTETSPVATCNPVGGLIKAGSIGQPVPGTVIDIVSLEDGKTCLPVGEAGEICISGPQVMKGYFNKPEETENVIRDGRLHTGDIGYMDEDGYVFIVDRLKDMILVSGYNVYPRQVEEAIYTHSAVEECVVAGVPDDKRGETVWAWIKLKDGEELSGVALRKFLRDKVSPIEMPRKFIFRDTPLPKTAVGKLSRMLLKKEEGIA